jgi:hypothetical protein
LSIGDITVLKPSCCFWHSRSGTPIGSPWFEAITRADKSPKYMDFMTNAYESTAPSTCGDTARKYLIIWVCRQSSKTKSSQSMAAWVQVSIRSIRFVSLTGETEENENVWLSVVARKTFL